ncbi:hypothetical protein CLIB1423_09S02256 [[Candida] railenensis]|uniref:SWI/SNF complex subunit SWI3 n=1 Tax=[Candida] railenensis TaxID=45579 RepID=A0A9P0VYZ6_9ASCO|nr:hypothetical protein CLIB1423_09S02256 [[Candida] railenensis]
MSAEGSPVDNLDTIGLEGDSAEKSGNVEDSPGELDYEIGELNEGVEAPQDEEEQQEQEPQADGVIIEEQSEQRPEDNNDENGGEDEELPEVDNDVDLSQLDEVANADVNGPNDIEGSIPDNKLEAAGDIADEKLGENFEQTPHVAASIEGQDESESITGNNEIDIGGIGELEDFNEANELKEDFDLDFQDEQEGNEDQDDQEEADDVDDRPMIDELNEEVSFEDNADQLQNKQEGKSGDNEIKEKSDVEMEDAELNGSVEVEEKSEGINGTKDDNEIKVENAEEDEDDDSAEQEFTKLEDGATEPTPSIEQRPVPEENPEDIQTELEQPDEVIPSEPVIQKPPIKQTHAIVIPSYSSWFKMNKIHKLEKDSLPEFFNTKHTSKSPKIYANYRNFMINAYRLNPNEYLTLTSCRRNLVGDVGTLMRVHKFLNKWGLINYQVNPIFKPGYAIEKLPNGSSVGLPYTGDFHVQYDTPRGLFPFNTYKASSENIDIGKLKEFLKKSEKSEKGDDEIVSSKRSGDVLESKRLKATKVNDSWTSKEISKLVTGIKENKNDWYKIAKAVGTKSPEECILKFLKLPIEDEYADGQSASNILKYAPNFPISSVDNPVLSNLAFMTQLVDSEVARAASARASKVIEEQSLEKIKEVYGSEEMEKKVGEEKSEQEESETKEAIKEEKDSVQEALEESKERKEDDLSDILKDDDLEMEEPEVAQEVVQEREQDQEQVQEKEQKQQQQNGHSNIHTPAMTTPPAEDEDEENNVLAEASANTFGIVGARGHLFANYEEREMNKLSSIIVNQQLAKVDLKLKKVEELEKTFEKERQFLAKQQEEVFIDRLALSKSTIKITQKLNEALKLLQKAQQKKPSSDKASTPEVREATLEEGTSQVLDEEMPNGEEVVSKEESLSEKPIPTTEEITGDANTDELFAEDTQDNKESIESDVPAQEDPMEVDLEDKESSNAEAPGETKEEKEEKEEVEGEDTVKEEKEKEVEEDGNKEREEGEEVEEDSSKQIHQDEVSVDSKEDEKEKEIHSNEPDDNQATLEGISSLLLEVQSLLYKSSRQTLAKSNNVTQLAENGLLNLSTDKESEKPEDIKPLSIDTPQAFKVWAP